MPKDRVPTVLNDEDVSNYADRTSSNLKATSTTSNAAKERFDAQLPEAEVTTIKDTGSGS